MNITDYLRSSYAGRSLDEALRQPELQNHLRKLSAVPFGGSPERAANYMRQEVERWGNVIKAAAIKLQ